MLRNHSLLRLILAGICVVALLGAIGYFWQKTEQQKVALAELAEAKALSELRSQQALEEASSTIFQLETTLLETEEDLDDTERDLEREKDKNDEFANQIKKLTGTVRDLDKLSKTDEELLQKYSKVYFLNENYVPSDIDKIDDKYILAGKDDQYFHGDARPFLEDLLDRAKRAGHDIKVSSAYRSFDEQTTLKGQYTQTYGSGANTFSADQGYSEHQLGTTIDLTSSEVGGTYPGFAETDAYDWLLKNAHRYGFILSYPEDNSFYVFEPWHWRFVGTKLAGDLHDKNANFYDWDQRKIDEYLLNIFD